MPSTQRFYSLCHFLYTKSYWISLVRANLFVFFSFNKTSIIASLFSCQPLMEFNWRIYCTSCLNIAHRNKCGPKNGLPSKLEMLYHAFVNNVATTFSKYCVIILFKASKSKHEIHYKRFQRISVGSEVAEMIISRKIVKDSGKLCGNIVHVQLQRLFMYIITELPS